MDCYQVAVDLIVTIVNKGRAESVVDAAKKAGAEGGTILPGRGTGIHERAQILGIPIQPEKEIVLILIPKTKTAQVLEAIDTKIDLEKPGRGLAFVVDIEKVIGICHTAQ